MPDPNPLTMSKAADDELGPYRSLSAFAVLSLILGLLSFLSFAPTVFFILTIPPAAVLFGVIAWYQIAKAPEVWTGRRLAHIGIGLAVICTIGGVSDKYFDSARMARQGKAAADRFLDKLKTGDLESAFWLTMPREARKEFEKKFTDDIPGQLLEKYGSFRMEVSEYAREMASGTATVEFERVESTSVNHNTEFAAMLYKYHSPKGDSNVLVVANSIPSPETHEPTWFIREHRFGYTPSTYSAPVSSGHSHSH